MNPQIKAAEYAVLNVIRFGRLDLIAELNPDDIYHPIVRNIASLALSLRDISTDEPERFALADKLPGGLRQFNESLREAEVSARIELGCTSEEDPSLPIVRALDNTKRMHSSLGYLAPDEYEKLWSSGELKKLGINPCLKLKGDLSN